MNLSKRLHRLSRLVTEGSRLADVGTDHGYVPICLIEEEKIPSAIAMDVNQGPLDRAKEHIREKELGGRIETRLSDGLAALKDGEADTVLIAGMGGNLTVRILTEGEAVLSSVKELILQPQSEIAGVRRWLCEHGFQIVLEDIIWDEGKFYPMFRAVHGEQEAGTPEEQKFGRLSLQTSLDTLEDFLRKSLGVQKQILESLPGEESERTAARRAEVLAECECLNRTLASAAEEKKRRGD